MWDRLFASADLLQKGLQTSWLRDSVIRSNLANFETPGFKSSDVEFESVFLQALEEGSFSGKRTREKHIPIGGGNISALTPKVTLNKDISMRMDGNNVDIEAENVKMAQNTMLYNTIVAKLNSELTRIRLAISEGK